MSSKLIVHSDGASRGNPGPAGAGAVITDPSGRIVREIRLTLPRVTNNVAEYEGAIAGLEAALEEGAEEVELRADSELLVRQLQGAYKVRAPGLVPLHARAAGLVSRFATARFTHVPRAENAHADRLANEAIDRASAMASTPRAAKEHPEILGLPAEERARLALRLLESLSARGLLGALELWPGLRERLQKLGTDR